MIEFRILSEEWKEPLLEFFRALTGAGMEKYFHPHPFDPPAADRLSRYRGKDFYCVAVQGKKVVGYGMLRGWDEGYEVPSLGIAIHPLFQNQGLGESLMNFLHSAAKARGAKKIRLTVYDENVEAISFYRKMGYVFSPGENQRSVGSLPLE